MRLPALIILALSAYGVTAQSYVDHYHSAARQYINGDLSEAEISAEAGLSLNPTDVRLNALLERIRRQKERQQQQQQNAGSGNEGEQNDQPQAGDGNQRDSRQQDTNREGEGGSENSANENRPRDGSEADADRPPDEREPDDQPEQDRPGNGAGDAQSGNDADQEEEDANVEPSRMSRAEAERILRALRADESTLLRSIQRRAANPRRVERDW